MKNNRLWIGFLVLMLAAMACESGENLPALVTVQAPEQPVSSSAGVSSAGGLSEIPLQVGYGYQSSFYELYFTDPFNRAADMQEGGVDAPLVAAIDSARQSVDVAIYSLSLQSVQDALLRAHQRGVTVRIVMESDNMERTVPQRLIGAGIEIIGDRREGLMHNKFVVIDRSEVWLGSTNFTSSGVYDDNNNLIRIRSTKIAENYTVEFEEMFVDDFFGPDVIAQTPNPAIAIDGIMVETYFSPDDKVAKRIVELLKGAKKSIYFLAYSFTADDFANVLLQKEQDGLAIVGVMDDEQARSNQGGEFATFTDAGIDVRIDGNAGLMHHKVFIIDEQIVILGSYNFSASAEKRNDENVIIIFDADFAKLFMQEFERVYDEGKR